MRVEVGGVQHGEVEVARQMEQQQRLTVRTLNSVYEVLVRRGLFRRVEGAPGGTPPLTQWRRFHRMGPLLRGRPMRLWWSRSESGRVATMGLLTTAPVVEVTADGQGDPEDGPTVSTDQR